MAHSAEEKIKILYEDSLAEMKELAARLEKVSGEIVSVNSETLQQAARKLNGARVDLQNQMAGIGKLVAALNDAEKKNCDQFGDETFSKMLRNAAASRSDVISWLAAANKKLDSFLYLLIFGAIGGGIVGGAVVVMVQKIF
jgi:hypothetical protein